MNELAEYLAVKGLRVTNARKAVFLALKQAEHPVDIRTLVIQSQPINRVSVYRCLELFINLGVADVVTVGWKKRYELAGPFAPHHHHLQCTACGELVAINTPKLEYIVNNVAALHGYQLTSHHIELSGTCSACRKLQKLQ